MRTVFAVLVTEPGTGRKSVNADIDWTIGDAAVVADSLGGVVCQAPLGTWTLADPEKVAEALAEVKDATMESELQNWIEGKENP